MALLVTVLATAVLWSRHRRRALAEALGLTLDGGEMVGVIDGVPVVVHTVRRGGKNKTTHTIVEATLRGAPHDLSMVRSGGTRDLRVGDPPFDDTYRLDATGLGLAWLSAHARDTLLTYGLVVRDGRVISDRRGDVEVSAVREILAAMRTLQVDDPVATLGHVVASDPSARMRALAIGALVEEGCATATQLDAWAEQPGLPGTLARACTGRPLGSEVHATDNGDRYLLAEHLARNGPASAIAELVDALGPDTERPVWFRVTEAATRHPGADVRTAVARAVERLGRDVFFADRAALALVTGGPEVEALLEPLLPRLEQSLSAVFGWLEEHGDVGAVPWLDRVTAASWPLSDTRDRAQKAKRAIQSRAGGERGGLALAHDGAAGALSEARNASGRLGER